MSQPNYTLPHFLLLHLNQHLARVEASPVTLEDASSAPGIKISKAPFICVDKEAGSFGVDIAFEPAFFAPLRVDEAAGRHGLAHLARLDCGSNEDGDGDEDEDDAVGYLADLSIRPRANSQPADKSCPETVEDEDEDEAPFIPETPRLRPVSDASFASLNRSDSDSSGTIRPDSDVPDLQLDHVPVLVPVTPRPRALSDASCSSLGSGSEGSDLIGGIPDPTLAVVEDELSGSEPGSDSDSESEDEDAEALTFRRGSCLNNIEAEDESSDIEPWISNIETPAPAPGREIRTAPLHLPHTTLHLPFSQNPGQILFENARAQCWRVCTAAGEVEGVLDTRQALPPRVSIGDLGIGQARWGVIYPWAVGDVYVTRAPDVDWVRASPHPDTVVTVIIGAGGTDEELCTAEFKAAVGVLLYFYDLERSEGMSQDRTGPISVLLISYFGSGHGRIMQAHHDGANLNIQYSPLVTFNMRDHLAEALFIRYTACRPIEL
ncbi:hypothetical protein BDW74DRAFT_180004 [Aspergillus multicolor]|uniref:uncharacterized protein n=1 Tax=Aspergillus multicolor TaxID=41759 RepID=UPI003CCD599C